ncbi:MAG TPA: preprotein translocase subunit YajC [Actinobacteria bacterium]|nr:preprotein translocase subunit YajC [Actinomycetota bacterium]
MFQLAQAAEDGGGDGAAGIIPFLVVMALISYFMFIRPQRNRAKKQRALAGALSIGDQVRTYGGLFGVVLSIDDEMVVLGIEEGRVRIAKPAIAVRLPDPGESEE